MGLLDKIKQSAKTSSESKSDFFWTKDGDKKRIRMLCEFDDGIEVVHHSYVEFKKGRGDVPCQKHFGRECPFCNGTVAEETIVKTYYGFPIYNQNESKQQIMLAKAWKSSSPLMPMVKEYELCEMTTFCDRDFLIVHDGSGKEKDISVRSQDPCKMEQKITPWTKAEIMEKIDKAYPYQVQLDIETEADSDDDMPF